MRNHRITVFDALRYVIAYLKGAAISWGQSAAEISIEDIPYEYRSEVAKAPKGTFAEEEEPDRDAMRKLWNL